MSSYFSSADLFRIAPLVVLSFGAFCLLLMEVFIKGAWDKARTAGLFTLVAFVSLYYYRGQFFEGSTAFQGLLFTDPYTFFFAALILIGTFITRLLSDERLREEGVGAQAEYFSLLLMCSVGAMIFVAARELIVLFLGLEIMSIALYCLCGSALWSTRSSESALKYFLLGSFSSAVMLFGMSLLYGLSGTLVIPDIASALSSMPAENMGILLVAIGLMLVGFGFKIGLVPFHFWAPDVYQGSPTPITAYMACVVKAAAVAAAIRVMTLLFVHGDLFSVWSDAIWFIAAITMTIGNLSALRQRSVKRMLAYSSIAHAGYMFVAFIAPETGGLSAILFYLVTYTAMTFGAFGITMIVANSFPEKTDADDISNFNGLGFTRPMLGVLMTIFMFSLAGLPPGLAGLLGKFYLFNAAVKANFISIAVIGVLNSAISCYYYLNVLVAMYFRKGEVSPSHPVGMPMAGALGVCAAASIFLGVFPSKLYEIAAYVVTTF
ncbi:MAG: NADH-quinone oxidoreductase subunit N [Deltaproteobacteria bacterium]|nr:NADH-quinone oxidoreductase subunit N [Deltaproteobacteria bacterium]